MNAGTFKAICLALVLAVLAAALPVGLTTAQGHEPNCPPIGSLQNGDPGFLKSLPKECRQKNRQPAPVQMQALSQVSLLSTGGPDEFGYTYDDTVPFNWTSASIFIPTISGDESSVIGFNIGFNFPFYGAAFSELMFTTNGLVVFDHKGSTCCYWGGVNIPDPALPDNFIAPFWEDLVVGSIYNSGGIYYDTGGSVPNRYFVLEWRDVTTYNGSDPFSFQVILYENGDIIIQHQSLPASYYSTVGIENATGEDGLQYQVGDTGLAASRAIKFTYPTTPMARLQVSPLSSGKFASTSADVYFPIAITNNGSAGTDTYDLAATSSWPASFYQYDSINNVLIPLTDTDGDTLIDTGPMPQGNSMDLSVGFTPPAGLNIGDVNKASILVASSLDPVKTKTASMDMAIPTSFAQVFEDYVDAAMAFRINQPEGTLTNYVTADFYYGNGLATIGLPDGRYLYTWRKPDGNYPNSFSDIEFTFLSNDGTTSTPIAKLTSNVGTGQTYDYQPSVAVASNGTIGVTWYRWLVDNTTGQYNYNIYFAAISGTGVLLSGPINITNNNLWDNFDNVNVPHFSSPTIAATNDNRFILSWEEYRTDGIGVFDVNIWYFTIDSSGANPSASNQLTNNGRSYIPILNPLKNGNVILTLTAFDGARFNPYFAVINGNGTLSQPVTNLDPGGTFFPYTTPDAVALSNGNIAIAWPTFSGIVLSMLDPAYNVISGPTFTNNPYTLNNQTMSITNDADDRIVMTWTDFDSFPSTQMFYALADSTGTFVTNPIPMRTSASGLITSENGQGNAPYPIVSIQEPMEVVIDIKPYIRFNVLSLKEYFVPVAIISTKDFSAPEVMDRGSLTFGKTGDENSLLFCLRYRIFANHDKLPDLLCYFRVNKTGFEYGDTEGILKGMALDNTPVEGRDSIKILKPPPQK